MGWGRGMGSECLMGTESQVWDDAKVLEVMVGMVSQPCESS